MTALVLLPGLICLFYVLRGRASTALLSVYLPTLLLLPESYTIRLPHLPELSVAEYCVIPVGILALVRLIQRGQFVLMDFLVGSFLMSLTTSEVMYEHVTKDGITIAAISFISMLLPYAIGRAMIEPDSRIMIVRRIVALVLLLGIPGVFEWRMGRNLYATLGEVFGSATSPLTQLRGSHGRFAAAFLDAEMAGAAIAMVAALNAWLAYLWRTGAWNSPGRLFTFLEKYRVAEVLLLGYVVLTQSRGPELALLAGYLILQIARFKNPKKATAIIAILIGLGSAAAYQYFNQLTTVSDINDIHNEQQGSALYRRRMIELFQPILKEGGWLGWGYKSFPHAEGLGNLGNGVQSIDNEFLYVYLGQGTIGFSLFVLIAAESLRTLVKRAWQLETGEDRAFAVSMLAATAMLWISLATVYMGVQLPQIAFLLIGWGQSIKPGLASTASQENAVVPQFVFRRVFS